MFDINDGVLVWRDDGVAYDLVPDRDLALLTFVINARRAEERLES